MNNFKGNRLRRLLCGALVVAMMVTMVVSTNATESVASSVIPESESSIALQSMTEEPAGASSIAEESAAAEAGAAESVASSEASAAAEPASSSEASAAAEPGEAAESSPAAESGSAAAPSATAEPSETSAPSESKAPAATEAPAATAEQLTTSGIEGSKMLAYDKTLTYLDGITVTSKLAGDTNQYRVAVAGVKTPEGGSYTYKEGDTGISFTEADIGLAYTITYKIQYSADGKTWKDLAEQPTGMTTEVSVILPLEEESELAPMDGEVDGIEISTSWVDAEAGKEINNGYSGNSTAALTPQAQLNIATGGAHTFAPGAITVRVPYVIWQDKDGNDIVPTSYGVTEKPVQSATSGFWYYIDNHGTSGTDDDEIVFENYNTITGRNNIAIQWAYIFSPWDTVDMSNANLPATLKANSNFGMANATNFDQTATPLTYLIDKQIGVITSSEKACVSTECKDASNGLVVTPVNVADHVLNYAIWSNNEWIRHDLATGDRPASDWDHGGTYGDRHAQDVWGPVPTKAVYDANYYVCWQIPLEISDSNTAVNYKLQDQLPAGAKLYNVYVSDREENCVLPEVDNQHAEFNSTFNATTGEINITQTASDITRSDAAPTLGGEYNISMKEYEKSLTYVYVTIQYPKPTKNQIITNTVDITASAYDNPAKTATSQVTAEITAALDLVQIDKIQNATQDLSYTFNLTFYMQGWLSRFSTKVNNTYVDEATSGSPRPTSANFGSNYIISWAVQTNITGTTDGSYSIVDTPTSGTIIGYSGVGWQWDGANKFTYMGGPTDLNYGYSITEPERDLPHTLRVIVAYKNNIGLTQLRNNVTGTLVSTTINQPDQVATDTAVIPLGAGPGHWDGNIKLPYNNWDNDLGQTIFANYYYMGDQILSNNAINSYNGVNAHTFILRAGYENKYLSSSDSFWLYDAQQVRFNNTDNVSTAQQLQAGDYQYTSLVFNQNHDRMNYYDPNTGMIKALGTPAAIAAGYNPKVDIYVLANGSWQTLVTNVALTDFDGDIDRNGDYIPDGGITYSTANGTLPLGVTAYMATIYNVKNAPHYELECISDMQLLPSAHMKTLMNSVPNGENFYIWNQGQTDCSSRKIVPADLNDFGNESVFPHGAMPTEDVKIEGSLYLRLGVQSEKKVSAAGPGDNNTALHRVEQTVTLQACELVPNSPTVITKVLDGTLSGYHTEMDFYDLLPIGVEYDGTKAVQCYAYNMNSDPNNYYSATATLADDNYKNTGRQLVEIHAVYTGPNTATENNITAYLLETARSGFKVTFGISTPWENLKLLDENTNINLAAAQVLGTDTFPDKDNTHIDTITDSKTDSTIDNYFKDFKDITTGAAAVGCFEDLNGDHNTTRIDTTYMAATYARPSVPVNLRNGLTKYVQANGSGWTDKVEVEAGDDYQYELYLKNDTDGRLKGTVIYDIFESDTGSAWKGTFRSINTFPASLLGIKPVVYYSVATDLTYDDFALTGTKKIDNTAVWTTTEPADKSTIRAIAVDLTKTPTNEEYVFEPDTYCTMIVYMTAPATYRHGKALNTPLLYTYTMPVLSETGSWSSKLANQTEVKMPSPPAATVRVRKDITNFNPADPDQSDQPFYITLSSADTFSDIEASVSLNNAETSKDITVDITGEQAVLDVSEVIPMEYIGNYKVVIENATGSTATVVGTKVTLHPGDECTIVVKNTFEHQPFFKAWNDIINSFDATD